MRLSEPLLICICLTYRVEIIVAAECTFPGEAKSFESSSRMRYDLEDRAIKPIVIHSSLNTGSNYLYHEMKQWQLPVLMFNAAGWYDKTACFRWKHMPFDLAQRQQKCTASNPLTSNEIHIALVRHPLPWRDAMARNHYLSFTCQSTRSRQANLYNTSEFQDNDGWEPMSPLRPGSHRKRNQNITISRSAMRNGPCMMIHYDRNFGQVKASYHNMLDVWNHFYGDYLHHAQNYLLFVRYEDVLHCTACVMRRIARAANCTLAKYRGKPVTRKIHPGASSYQLKAPTINKGASLTYLDQAKLFNIHEKWRDNYQQNDLEQDCNQVNMSLLKHFRYSCLSSSSLTQ